MRVVVLFALSLGACADVVQHGGTSGARPVDPCAGLELPRTLARERTPLARPAVGATVVDPAFGTTIRRVTDAAALGSGAVVPLHHRVASFNADESLALLYAAGRGHLLYDASSWSLLGTLDLDPPDLEQVYWVPDEPSALWYVSVSAQAVVRLDVRGGGRSTVVSLSACSGAVSSGEEPIGPAWRAKVLGLLCRRGSASQALVADLAEATLGPWVASSSGTAPRFLPLGTRAVLGATLVDRQLTTIGPLAIADDLSPSGVLLGDGGEALVGASFESPAGQLLAVPLDGAAPTVLVGPGAGDPYPAAGAVVSALPTEATGFVTLASVGDPRAEATVLDGELVLYEVGGRRLCRVAHHRNWGASPPCTQCEWSRPLATLSPRGTRVLFASDWGAGTGQGGDVVDTYVVELPAR